MLKAVKTKLKRRKTNGQLLNPINNHHPPAREEDAVLNDILPSDFFKKLVKIFFTWMMLISIAQGFFILKYSSVAFEYKCFSIFASNFITCFFNLAMHFVMMLIIIENPNSIFHVKDELNAMMTCGVIASGELMIFIIPSCIYYLISNESYNYVQTNIPELWNIIALQTAMFWLLAGIGLGGLITVVTMMHFLDNE